MRSNSVAIVGAGVSGLAAGVFLSKLGHNVTIYECSNRVGGCCTTTEIDGYVFNDGAIYLAIPEILDYGFARLGLDRTQILPLRKISRQQASRFPDGSTISIANGRTLTIAGAGIAGQAGALQRELDRFVARWEPAFSELINQVVLHPFSLARVLKGTWRHLPKLTGTVASELGRHVASPHLRAALANVTLYTGLPPDQTPSMQILGAVAMLLDKFYLPEGGMDAIPAVLAAEFARHGGTLQLNADVASIVLSNRRVHGVSVRGHGTAPFDAVISAVGGMTTCTSLLNAADVPAPLLRKTAKAPLSQRGLSVQLGLRNRLDDVSHFNYCTPMLEEQRKMVQPATGKASPYISYIVPTVSMPELARNGGSIVEMFPPIDQDLAVAGWTPEAGAEVAESALSTLSSRHALDIAVKRIRTPKDFRDRMYLYDGAFYGLSPTAGPRAQYQHMTSIDGLFQAGQTTHPGFGVGPSILSGIFAAECVARQRT